MTSLKEYFTIPGFSIEEIIQTEIGTIIIKAFSTCTDAVCPQCHQVSTKQHSTYIRHPQDLPWRGNTLFLHLKMKRFRCTNPACSRVTFGERIPSLAETNAHRTTQLEQVLHAISFETSAEATARISHHLKIQISPDTILRILRKTIFNHFACPRVLGVDDWALKRGHNYGTLLIDLESRKPVDLLPGRNSAVLETWLNNHTAVEIVSRDRSKEYKAGIDAALPKAIQIADRWHLYLNLRQRLEKTIPKERKKPQSDKKELLSQGQKNFDNVRYLHAQGYSTRAIARALVINRATVLRYIHADHFPDYRRTAPTRSNLDVYGSYIRKRWRAGCHHARTIWQELCALVGQLAWGQG